MDKPVLSRIDILVYPFHGINQSLETPAGIAKFNQWVKQVEYAGRKKDSFMIVVHDSFSEHDAVRKQFDHFLKTQLGEGYVTVKSRIGGLSKNELALIFGKIASNFLVSTRLEIRRFGQVAPDASIEKVGAPISRQLAEFLGKFGVVSKEKSVSGLSIKQSEAYLSAVAARRLKGNLNFTQDLFLRTIAAGIKEKGRTNPASLAHAIKRGNSFEEIRANLQKLRGRAGRK